MSGARELVATDLWFGTQVTLPRWRAACQALRALGLAAHINASADLDAHDLRARVGIAEDAEVRTAVVHVFVDDARDGAAGRVEEVLAAVPAGALVEVSFSPLPDRSALALERRLTTLEAALRSAAELDVRLALYPHVGLWLERVDDALRVRERLALPDLGVVFSVVHWLAGDGTPLGALLARAHDALALVSVCGSRHRLAPFPATVEPIFAGRFRLPALVAALETVGYQGPIVLHAYEIPGDPVELLRRSARTAAALGLV